MNGHTRWWMEHPEEAMTGYMAQYVQGYILAMEDILRDLDRFRVECESDTAIIEGLEKSAKWSRDSARRTLDTITKKEST